MQHQERAPQPGRRRAGVRARSVLLPLAAASLAIGSSLVAVPAAQAKGCSGDPISKTWTRPTHLTLDASTAQTATFTVATRHSCGVKHVKVKVSTALFPNDIFALAKYTTQGDKDYWGVTYTVSPQSLYNAEAGKWTIRYTVTGDSPDHAQDGHVLEVRRAAKLSKTDVGASTVASGDTVTVRSRATRADWDKAKFADFGGARVDLTFRPSDGSTRTVRTVRAAADGRLHSTVTAKQSGCYSWVFPANTSTDRATAGQDCITVRS